MLGLFCIKRCIAALPVVLQMALSVPIRYLVLCSNETISLRSRFQSISQSTVKYALLLVSTPPAISA